MARVARYCACGSTLAGTITPDHIAVKLLDAWAEVHNQPGCAVATANQAAAARRRNDRNAARTAVLLK
jgi:hypothetical protein